MSNKENNQRRAKQGGEVGANGEWYEGGKYIATTERGKGKPGRKGTGRQRIAANDWAVAPEGMMSLYSQFAHLVNWNTREIMEGPCNYYGKTVEEVAEMMKKWEAGQNWTPAAG